VLELRATILPDIERQEGKEAFVATEGEGGCREAYVVPRREGCWMGGGFGVRTPLAAVIGYWASSSGEGSHDHRYIMSSLILIRSLW
jgi:uncharacterized protein (UPF0303 family)